MTTNMHSAKMRYYDFSRTGNVLILFIKQKDAQLAKRCDLYATLAWFLDNDAAGFEYFEFFADRLGLDYEVADRSQVPKESLIWSADSIELDTTCMYEIQFRRLIQEWYDEQ